MKMCNYDLIHSAFNQKTLIRLDPPTTNHECWSFPQTLFPVPVIFLFS